MMAWRYMTGTELYTYERTFVAFVVVLSCDSFTTHTSFHVYPRCMFCGFHFLDVIFSFSQMGG